MPRPIPKAYSPALLDAAFIIAGLSSVVRLVFSGRLDTPAIDAIQWSYARGLTIVALTVAGAVVAAYASRLDQKCADDYVFTTLAKSALIGMVGLIAFTALWEALFADHMGTLPETGILAVAIACWSVGYFYTRVRGTRA